MEKQSTVFFCGSDKRMLEIKEKLDELEMSNNKDKRHTWFSGNAWIKSTDEFKEMFYANRAAWNWVLRHSDKSNIKSGELICNPE